MISGTSWDSGWTLLWPGDSQPEGTLAVTGEILLGISDGVIV